MTTGTSKTLVHNTYVSGMDYNNENMFRLSLSGDRLRPLTTLLVLLLHQTFPLSSTTALNYGIEGGRTWSRREWLQSSCLLPVLTTNAFGVPSKAIAEDAGPYLTDEYYHPNLATNAKAGRFYFPALTPPFRNRATYRYELGRHQWAFEQLLTFANVTATIRMTVVELTSTGGLWVHSPQCPTGELMALLRDLNKPIEHIVLPCNALEHKAPMKDFCHKFPNAHVWISPGQYGPFGSCGRSLTDPCQMGYRVDGILGSPECHPSWEDEFDMATLYVDLPENAGPVSEVAFCHKPTHTLIATDAVVYIPSQGPPSIFGTYFDQSIMDDDPNFWPKSVLQAVFLPLRQDSDSSSSNANTLYPSYPGFTALQDRLIRAPILRAFSDARAPQAALQWIEQIGTWKYDRIVTSHFASPIRASPQQFKGAFGYLQDPPQLTQLPPITCQDWELLEGLNQIIAKNQLGAIATFDYSKGCL
jgi:hypothetical protein